MSDWPEWHSRRVEAAAQALAPAAEGDLGRAEAAIRAADRAVGGIVPREEYERLAIEYGAWKVHALQTDGLLERALEALDRIAGSPEGAAVELRNLAFVTAVEVRAALDARSEDNEERA